ncbi:hypothetical protein MKW92_014864 [Papaver armeniacum]|nr:hypothetical protein MKW92_014864 [Papaver armeniacum]
MFTFRKLIRNLVEENKDKIPLTDEDKEEVIIDNHGFISCIDGPNKGNNSGEEGREIAVERIPELEIQVTYSNLCVRGKGFLQNWQLKMLTDWFDSGWQF